MRNYRRGLWVCHLPFRGKERHRGIWAQHLRPEELLRRIWHIDWQVSAQERHLGPIPAVLALLQQVSATENHLTLPSLKESLSTTPRSNWFHRRTLTLTFTSKCQCRSRHTSYRAATKKSCSSSKMCLRLPTTFSLRNSSTLSGMRSLAQLKDLTRAFAL